MAMEQLLRPIERRVLALKASGQTTAEIARRFKRGDDHIERIIGWTKSPRSPRERPRQGLRPVERRVLSLRDQGMSYGEIGARFRKDAEFARRVEGIAHMRNSLGLLADS
jgi:DNA-binding CsgD family transcriptional regulator